jgi:hypothetical protein
MCEQMRSSVKIGQKITGTAHEDTSFWKTNGTPIRRPTHFCHKHCHFPDLKQLRVRTKGERGDVVVKTLRYKPAGRGSIPDGVIGIFQ